MKELTTEQLKEIALTLLSQIDSLCQTHGIRYSMADGTLLGAVRHQGFIPWDDDIDLLMPRDDYQRFIQLCQQTQQPFRLCCRETEPGYRYLFAKVWDPATYVEETHTNRMGCDMGVFIDILPVDGLGDTIQQARQVYRDTLLRRELLVAANWKHFFRSKTKSWIYEPVRFGFYVLSRLVNGKKLVDTLDRELQLLPLEKAAYAGSIMGPYRQREIMDSSVFQDFTRLKFEGREFMALRQYHKYLSALYGDYMTLPPEDKRRTHHDFRAYYREGGQK